MSYRSFFETPAAPLPLNLTTPSHPPAKSAAPGTSLLSASLSLSHSPSLLTSSLRNAPASNPLGKENLAPSYPAVPEARAAMATMTTTKVRSRREKEYDRLAWMEGVKIIRPPQAVEAAGGDEDDGAVETAERFEGVAEDQLADPSTRASSVVRGTDTGTLTAREGDETERAESVLSGESRQTGTAIGKDILYANLGEEITSVVRRFGRINFEKASASIPSCSRASTHLIRPIGPRCRSHLHRLALQSAFHPRRILFPAHLPSHEPSRHRA